MILLSLFVLATVTYTGILVISAVGLARMKKPANHPDQPDQSISVIIAARNEAANLPRLLISLAELEYNPEAYEVIIVNDHSTDTSMDILGKWQNDRNHRVIDWQGHRDNLIGKKAAIQMGIEAARYDILVFTDADCIVPPGWLNQMSGAFKENVDYVLAYSLMQQSHEDSTMRLKNFERAVYYAFAAAGLYYRLPVTSSACNMAYRKSTFLSAGGFEGIGHLASGDDDLLLMKMMPYIRDSRYLTTRDAQVRSLEGINIRKRHHTNIRRASKFRYFPVYLQAFALFMFLYFASFYAALVLAVTGQASNGLIWLLAGKTFVEMAWCALHLSKLGLPKLVALYPVQIMLFPAQFLFYAVRGTLGKYSWK